MIFFNPDLVLPHDPAGFGLYLLGHYIEHKVMITSAYNLTPSVSIPDYALQSWKDDPIFVSGWLNAHYQIHTALRSPAGYSGVDLSAVDLTDDSQWDVWMQDHSSEHIALRSFYGIS